MVVVSDTSALSNLFKINRLELLRDVFGVVIVPEAVMRELLELEKRGIDLSPVKNAAWIKVRSVQNKELAEFYQKGILDEGESEAIVLAKELAANYLIMDEALGRKVAEAEGLKVIGVLGILRDAKSMGIIPAVRPVIDELRTVAKFRISESLVHLILTEAGELPN